jgi:hypothetical protein
MGNVHLGECRLETRVMHMRNPRVGLYCIGVGCFGTR